MKAAPRMPPAPAAAPRPVRRFRPRSRFPRDSRQAGMCDVANCRQPSEPPLRYRTAKALRATSACRCTLRIEFGRGLRHGPIAALLSRYLKVQGMRKRVVRKTFVRSRAVAARRIVGNGASCEQNTEAVLLQLHSSHVRTHASPAAKAALLTQIYPDARLLHL